jgi:uncharacterized protein YndB with AHSA1/START domain
VATVRTLINGPPEQVFAVLSDPAVYADWIVGSDTIRDADAMWPAVGSKFHHRIGIGLLKVNDHTEVVEMEPPVKLVLHARARPLGTALVTLLLAPAGGRTRVTMRETAGDALSCLALNPATDWLVHLRNREALRRLKRIVESRSLEQ